MDGGGLVRGPFGFGTELNFDAWADVFGLLDSRDAGVVEKDAEGIAGVSEGVLVVV